MSKFKNGDMVVRSSFFSEKLGEYFTHNDPTPFKVLYSTGRFDETLHIVDPNGGNHGEDYLELYEEAKALSPIQEIKTKVVVPGNYGIIQVTTPYEQPANLTIKFTKYCISNRPTIEDLRQLSVVAGQLADYMEENKDAYQYQ